MKKEIIKNLWGQIKELSTKDKKNNCYCEVTYYKKGITSSIICDYEINNSCFSMGEIGNKKDIIGNAKFKKGSPKADLIRSINGLDLP